ncbi:Hypothetical protein, putative [Bodo saltans]|uniref:Uncharacterized protein n=1 Tax=Bodo saltans TaxID=75058 RepID=A0A0S4J004_BODSA|nr:Hypothetical protein, putative [Bodo saltans]|eukprot:CUG32067.1 Hypothetical protein, putative [Bodo saltans]
MDSHHPRFREGIEALQRHQTEPPAYISIPSRNGGGTEALVRPLPPRPAVVQRALTLLTAAEADELERLSLRYEANREKLLSLRSKLSSSTEQHLDEAKEEGSISPNKGPSIATLRHQAATRSHSAMLSSVWALFSLQLKNHLIADYRDAGHLQDVINLVGVRPT